MSSFKLVFRLIDADTKEVLLADQQTILAFDPEQIAAVRSNDDEEKMLVRSAFINEICDAAGHVIGRFIQGVIRARLLS